MRYDATRSIELPLTLLRFVRQAGSQAERLCGTELPLRRREERRDDRGLGQGGL
jgi:hypothetical protein